MRLPKKSDSNVNYLNKEFQYLFSFIALILISILFHSCEKEEKQVSIERKSNLELINKYLLHNSIKNGPGYTRTTTRSVTSSAVSALESIDINSTIEANSFLIGDVNQEYFVYKTEFTEVSGLEGGVVSILLPNQRVLSYVSVIENIGPSHFVDRIYALSGEKIDSLEFLNGSLITPASNEGQGVPGSPLTPSDEVIGFANQTVEEVRSWWGCTRECARETTQVCVSDPHCYTMFVISNLPNGRIAGMGSLSIAAACGIMCLNNRDFNVLPSIVPYKTAD